MCRRHCATIKIASCAAHVLVLSSEGTGGACAHACSISPLGESAVATSISIPRSAAAADSRNQRSTAAEGRSAKGRDRRRPKAGVGACTIVEPAEHEPVQKEAPIRVRKGRFDPPCTALVCFAACMPQRRHVASQQRHAPFHGAFATRPSTSSTLPPSTNRNRSAPVPPLRSDISGHRRSNHVRALLSAAPSPEALIPPLSLSLPRLPSHHA